VAIYAAVLDACALVPISLADALLRIAERGLYRPLWSDEILREAHDAVVELHPDVDVAAIDRRFRLMNEVFEDAEVGHWRHTAVSIDLPDPDDIQVVQCAIAGGAQGIVTANIKDFPKGPLQSLDLEVIHPDDFLLDQFDLAPAIVMEVVREQALHTRNPALTVWDLAVRLQHAQVPQFADQVLRELGSL
jgi:hypothetical protein